MNFAKRQGSLSVETMIALQAGTLRVKNHCGTFTVAHRSYSNTSACKVYDHNLSVALQISLRPEGRGLVLDPVPARPLAASFAHQCAN